MDTNSVADRLRELRRRSGMTQEELAENAGVSANVVRKLEQGGTARMETYNALGRVLGVRTVWFMAPESPEPQPTTNRDAVLSEIRSVVNPAASLSGPLHAQDDVPPNLSLLKRAIGTVASAYQADSYDDIARMTPALVRSAHFHVRTLDGDQRREAVRMRADTLQLTGRYLIQVREHDLALIALRDALRDATDIGDQALAAAAIGQQAWALLRQARFSEVEQLCVTTADEIEPRMSKATPGELAAWGRLLIRAAAAAARNARIEEARELQGVASSAAAPASSEYETVERIRFGPVSVSMNGVQCELVAGEPGRALAMADEVPHDGGGVTPTTGQRYELDRAKAYVLMGDIDQATAILLNLKRNVPNWLKYQQAARDLSEDILSVRKRMPTEAQRALADFLEVPM